MWPSSHCVHKTFSGEFKSIILCTRDVERLTQRLSLECGDIIFLHRLRLQFPHCNVCFLSKSFDFPQSTQYIMRFGWRFGYSVM